MDTVDEVSKAAVAKKSDQAIVFFDGVCNFCNGTVNFVIDRDPKGIFRFASLQSEFAKQKLTPYDIDTSNLYSIILLKNDKVFHKSNAALEIARGMGGLWPLLYIFKIIPAFLRNLIYDFIARNRYKWFGKLDACRIPTPDIKERFLD